jgi:hypothetical protein
MIEEIFWSKNSLHKMPQGVCSRGVCRHPCGTPFLDTKKSTHSSETLRETPTLNTNVTKILNIETQKPKVKKGQVRCEAALPREKNMPSMSETDGMENMLGTTQKESTSGSLNEH